MTCRLDQNLDLASHDQKLYILGHTPGRIILRAYWRSIIEFFFYNTFFISDYLFLQIKKAVSSNAAKKISVQKSTEISVPLCTENFCEKHLKEGS